MGILQGLNFFFFNSFSILIPEEFQAYTISGQKLPSVNASLLAKKNEKLTFFILLP